jgi:jumonji domain-containing protein 7
MIWRDQPITYFILASNVEDVCYLQSQNGNLFPGSYFTTGDSESDCELANLRGDVPAEIPWCSEALGRCPDAVNLWIGNSRSVTSIHSGSIAFASYSTDLP